MFLNCPLGHFQARFISIKNSFELKIKKDFLWQPRKKVL